MSELDLDALKWEQRIRPNGDVIAILAVADFRALVNRLREAEASLANAGEALELALEHQVTVRLRNERLERVRKAAGNLEEVIVFPATASWHVTEMVRCRDELRAALAALEEPVKT